MPRAHMPRWLLATALLLSTAGLAGPLDPDDRAQVAVIDQACSDAVDTASAIRGASDDLTAIAAEQALAVDHIEDFAQAELRLDLERSMLRACAVRCPKQPLPPASAAYPRSSASCWNCVSPRMVITRANGGYLEDILDLVETDLRQATQAGLPLDLAQADRFLAAAFQAAMAGDTEEAFTNACQSFGVLACERRVR